MSPDTWQRWAVAPIVIAALLGVVYWFRYGRRGY
jgi:hypothetical protein